MAALLLLLALLSSSPGGWQCTSADVGFHVPVAAFLLAPGESLHPELPAADLAVDFAGWLAVPQVGRYRFALEVEGGEAELVVLSGSTEIVHLRAPLTDALGDWLELPRGEVELLVRFRREGDAPARLRTRWELENSETGGFPLEPIPSTAVRPLPGSATEPSAAERRAVGRELLARKGCLGCHAPERPLAVGRRFAPSLDGIGDRFGVDWMRRWIRSPHAQKPGADMPTLFADDGEAEEDVEALVHFLRSRPVDAPSPVAEEGDASRGRTLYHAVGCVPCHGPLDAPALVHGDDELDGELPEADIPFPFGDVTGKWRRDALAAFLRDPLAVRPDGRMPSLALTSSEAASLTAYLAEKWELASEEEAFVVDPALAQRGRREYAARSCRACHDPLDLTLSEPSRPALAEVRKRPRGGCLDTAEEGAPRYDLQDDERAFLSEAVVDLPRAAALCANLPLTMAELGCLACHEQDGVGGPPAELDAYFVNPDDRVDLLDEGRFAPDLTGVGFRLTPEWLDRVLLEGERARSYLHLRMPQYGAAHVGRLVEDLPRREGLAPGADLEPPPVPDDAARLGRELVTRSRLGCVACHVFRELPPAGTPGPAYTDFARRIRFEWFRSYLQNPQRFKRGSRMPDFGTGGVSSLGSIFDGDLARQGDALWAYFRKGSRMLPPETPFDPDADGVPVSPPPGAVVLFDGTDLASWSHLEGEPAQWKIVEGAMEVVPGTRDVVSRQEFGDALVHVEFRVPFLPDETGQRRGNSGVYLQARYEVQVLDSFGVEQQPGDCGAIYGKRIPDRNLCRKPERWQSFDILFRAPRFDAAGGKLEHARMTVWHNGVLIHDDFPVDGTTTAGLPGPEAARGPLRLQDHGNVVRYRNVWVLPL